MAALPAPPPTQLPLLPVLARAIADRRLVALRYHGRDRLVEPHILGVTGQGHEALSGWQVAGGSQSGAMSWKNFVLADVEQSAVTNARFAAPRSDYNPDDPTFALVLARL